MLVSSETYRAQILAYSLYENSCCCLNSPEDLNASNTVEKENFDEEGQIDEGKKEKDLLKHLVASLATGTLCSQVVP